MYSLSPTSRWNTINAPTCLSASATGGLGHLFDDIFALLDHRSAVDEQRRGADLGERAAYVALKNYDDDQNDRAKKLSRIQLSVNRPSARDET